MDASPTTKLPPEIHPTGMGFWMSAVSRGCDDIQPSFDPEPVHDLRVALRRCRSMADALLPLDPDPSWRKVKAQSKGLFRLLGSLRDIQVMKEWAQRLNFLQEEEFFALHTYLAGQESLYRQKAAEAILSFNQKRWGLWTQILPRRMQTIPLEGDVFQHLALEQWVDVHKLHRRALRNRTHVGYHRLRIALKKFRYTVENFLPMHYEQWGSELKVAQDLLGEMHDLHVLWQTVLATTAFRDKETRMDWHQHILAESDQRLQAYRQMTLGKTSLLIRWRAGLPGIDELRGAALARLRVWASFRDPDVSHSGHVENIALQIFDGLHSMNLLPFRKILDARSLLGAAATARVVGFAKHQKKHQIASYRMIRKLRAPIGLTAEALRSIALIVRFHRGRLPRAEQKAFSGLTNSHQRMLVVLSGILRLADALDPFEGRHIDEVQISKPGDILLISIPGYTEYSASAQRVAAARHLLEVACRIPIMVH
jgi:CHAD domain-containing protein